MTPGGLVIRRREAADLDAAARLLTDVHSADGYPVEGVEDPVAWLTGQHMVAAWVAELHTAVIGHVAVSRAGDGDAAAGLWTNRPEHRGQDPLVLGRLFVSTRARGAGVGRRLIETATTFATGADRRLVLDVMVKDRSAIALYERLGWIRIGETSHDDGHGQRIPAYCYAAPSG